MKRINLEFLRFSLTKLSSLQFLQLARFGTLMLGSIVIARLLPKTIVAEYENMVLVGSSLSFFWVSGIINTFIPFFQSAKAKQKRELIGLVYLLLCGLAFTAGAGAWLLKPALFKGDISVYGFYLLYAFFSAPAFLTEYLYFSIKKPFSLFIYTIFSQGLQLISLVLPLLLGYGLFVAVTCLAATGILRFLYLSFFVFKLSIFPSAKICVSFVKRSWPVTLSLLIGGSMLYLDSYIVRYFFTAETFAVFQYGARELPFVLLLANALSNVGSAEVALAAQRENLQQGLSYLKQKSERLMHILFPITILLLLISKPLFSAVYTHSFAQAAQIFDVYLLLIISRLVFPQTVLLALHQNKILLWAVAAEWIAKLALNLLFLQWFGLVGIAFSTVLAYLLEKTIHAHILHRQKILMAQYTPVKTWALYSVLLVVVFSAKYLLF